MNLWAVMHNCKSPGHPPQVYPVGVCLSQEDADELLLKYSPHPDHDYYVELWWGEKKS